MNKIQEVVCELMAMVLMLRGTMRGPICSILDSVLYMMNLKISRTLKCPEASHLSQLLQLKVPQAMSPGKQGCGECIVIRSIVSRKV